MICATGRIGLVVALLSLAAAATGSARAGTQTYYFAGNISTAIATDDPLPSDVAVGNAFTGSFTINTATPGTQNGSPGDNNNLNYFGALTSIQVTVGSTNYDQTSVDSAYNTHDYYSDWANVLYNEFPSGGKVSDIFAVSTGSYDYSHRGPSGTLIRNESLTLVLNDTAANPTALTTAQLGVDTLNLSQFVTQHYIQFSNIDQLNGTDQYFSGNISYLGISPQAVPEPSTLLLSVIAGLIFVGYAWSRHNASRKGVTGVAIPHWPAAA